MPRRSQPDGDAVGTAYLVPGRAYPPVAPLLFFAQSVLLQHGWAVRQVWWDPPAHASDEQTGAWVRGQVEAVLPDSGRVLLVGKSLATYAAPLAAERGFDAVWLTPLLQVPVLIDALAANPGRQLLVGGTADHIAWRPEVARRLAVPGARCSRCRTRTTRCWCLAMRCAERRSTARSCEPSTTSCAGSSLD